MLATGLFFRLPLQDRWRDPSLLPPRRRQSLGSTLAAPRSARWACCGQGADDRQSTLPFISFTVPFVGVLAQVCMF